MPVPETTSTANKAQCYIQPADLPALEEELKHWTGQNEKKNKKHINTQPNVTADNCDSDDDVDSICSSSSSASQQLDAFGDAWRSIRSLCKASMQRFVKSGGADVPLCVPNASALTSSSTLKASSTATVMQQKTHHPVSPYTFPSTDHLGLLTFTLRYTSMGKDYADELLSSAAFSSGGLVSAVLLDMVTYRSALLDGEGYEVALDLQKGSDENKKEKHGDDEKETNNSLAVDCAAEGVPLSNPTDVFIANMTQVICQGGEGDAKTIVVPEEVVAENEGGEEEDGDDPLAGLPKTSIAWLKAVNAFICGCEKTIANCSGSTAIALSDSTLVLVHNKKSQTNDETTPLPLLLPSPTPIRISYSDYSASETGARLWGGGVGLALLFAERTEDILKMVAEEEQNGDGVLESRNPFTMLELGAGVALPSCVFARCAAEIEIQTHGDRNQGDTSCAIDLITGDVFPSILDCAARNIQRQQLMGREAKQSINATKANEVDGGATGSGCGTATSVTVRQRSEIIDFFKVQRWLQGGEEEEEASTTAQQGAPSPSSADAAVTILESRCPNPSLLLNTDEDKKEESNTRGGGCGEGGQCDLIIASDIVYDHHIGKAGIAALGAMLRPCSSSSSSNKSIITATVEGETSGADSHHARENAHQLVDDSNTCCCVGFQPPLFDSFDAVLRAWAAGRRLKQSERLKKNEKDNENTNHGDDDADAHHSCGDTVEKTLHRIDGGIALLCCESHRDAMPLLPQFLAENGLTLLCRTEDIQTILKHYVLPHGTTISKCNFFVVAKFAK